MKDARAHAAGRAELPRDPDEGASGERLVFIGGLHRSGTSLIHRCLSDHPQASGFSETGAPEDEGQHLQSVYPPAWHFGRVAEWGFNRRSHLDESSPLVSRENATRLLAEWGRHWDTDKEVLLEKSPPNLVRTRFLQALFPDCRFIIVLRHPVAVGYASQKWTSRTPWLSRLGVPTRRMPKVWIGRLLRHWLVCHERFERDRPYLRQVHVLRYEDFVERPQEELDAMCAFLGLAPTPLTQQVRVGVNDHYLERWEKRRRNLLTRGYTNRTIRQLEERVSRFGYSLRTPAG